MISDIDWYNNNIQNDKKIQSVWVSVDKQSLSPTRHTESHSRLTTQSWENNQNTQNQWCTCWGQILPRDLLPWSWRSRPWPWQLQWQFFIITVKFAPDNKLILAGIKTIKIQFITYLVSLLHCILCILISALDVHKVLDCYGLGLKGPVLGLEGEGLLWSWPQRSSPWTWGWCLGINILASTLSAQKHQN